METERLLIRSLEDGDELSFVGGIRDKSLRAAYGFPPDMDDGVSAKIFRRFRRLERAFALTRRASGEMIGFLLDVEPELPEDLRAGLPENGRTLAFAVFPSLQRQGYMLEALRCYTGRLFRDTETAWIHCGHFTDNEASRNLLRKLGFRESGQHENSSTVIIDEILYRTIPDTEKEDPMEQKKELAPEELEKAGGGRHHGDLVRVKCECGKTTTGSPSAFPCTCTCGNTLYAPREY